MFQSNNQFDNEERPANRKLAISIGVLVLVLILGGSFAYTKYRQNEAEKQQQAQVLGSAEKEVREGQKLKPDQYERKLDSSYAEYYDSVSEENRDIEVANKEVYDRLVEQYQKVYKDEQFVEFEKSDDYILAGRLSLQAYKFPKYGIVFSFNQTGLQAISYKTNLDKTNLEKALGVLNLEGLTPLDLSNQREKSPYTYVTNQGVTYVDKD